MEEELWILKQEQAFETKDILPPRQLLINVTQLRNLFVILLRPRTLGLARRTCCGRVRTSGSVGENLASVEIHYVIKTSIR